MKTERIIEVLRAAEVNVIISAYGNEFFVAGQEGVDYSEKIGKPRLRFQRNTLIAIAKLGFLSVEPGTTGRGEFSLTENGRKFLTQYDAGGKQ